MVVKSRMKVAIPFFMRAPPVPTKLDFEIRTPKMSAKGKRNRFPADPARVALEAIHASARSVIDVNVQI